MRADWIFVIVLVCLALGSGWTLGLWRGKTLGRRSGRRSAWEEYTRQVGHAPPGRPSPQPGPASVTIEDADFRVQE
jgi:hypothetical protein